MEKIPEQIPSVVATETIDLDNGLKMRFYTLDNGETVGDRLDFEIYFGAFEMEEK
jgi:hypothetical protein